MPTNVESISNLMEEEEPKFREKKEKLDIGILMSSVMKNGEFADTVSQALDQMGGLDKQDLLDELNALARHFLDSLDHLSTSKSGRAGAMFRCCIEDSDCASNNCVSSGGILICGV